MHWARIFLVSLTIALFVGCGGDKAPSPAKDPETTPSGHAVLAPSAKVLDDEALSLLVGVDDDALFFSTRGGMLSDVAVGDVLIVGPSPLTPNGALVKVLAAETVGELFGLMTRPAAIEEGFEELKIHLDVPLRAEGEQEGEGPAPLGHGLAQSQQALGLSLPFSLSASSDSGKNHVEVQGSFSVDPSLSLVLDIDFAAFELKELSMRLEAKETFVADLKGHGDQPIDETITLGTIWFTPIPIVVPIPVPPGVLTIVLTPRLLVEAGIRGKLEGKMTASIRQDASFTAGLGYKDGRFQGFSDSDNRFDFEEPVYDASVNLKAFAGPRLDVLIYGLGGPYAGVEAFVDLSASLEGPPPCARGVLDGGLGAKAGVDFIASYSTTLFDKRFPLASFDSCTNDPNAPRPAITWARSFSRKGSQGEIAKAIVQAKDGSYLVVGDSSLFQGVQGFSAATWALRLDALGHVVWQRAFQQSGKVGLTQGAAEVPGGFLIAGSLGVMMLDSGGNLVWAKSYSSSAPMEIASIAAYEDGSSIAAGRQKSASFAMRLDAKGEIVWSKRFGGEELGRVRLLRDGGVMLVGRGGSDIRLIKLNAAGDIDWQKSLDNRFNAKDGTEDEPFIAESDDKGYDVAEKPSGGYVVVGQGYGNYPIPEAGPAGFYAPTVFELSEDGSLVKATIHRAPSDGDYGAAFAVGVRDNGNSVIVGRYVDKPESLLAREKLLVIQGGTFTTFGGGKNDGVHSGTLAGTSQGMPLAMTSDGGSAVLATSNSFSSTDQYWVVKLGRTANIDMPYRSGVDGSSYENPNAISKESFSPSSDIAVQSKLVTNPIQSEVTEMVTVHQTP